MNVSEERFESLTEIIEEYEKKSRWRVWISSMVPLFLGLVLLGYTIWQIQVNKEKLSIVQQELGNTKDELDSTSTLLQKTKDELDISNDELVAVQDILSITTSELEMTKEELNITKNELESLKKDLEEATQALRNANIFVENSYRIDPIDIKNSYGYLPPGQEGVLLFILNKQWEGVGWNPIGFSELEGFNSPGFALYVLQRFNLVSGNYNVDAKPWEILRPVNDLSNGDIVFYEGGFTMFYFEYRGQNFVIGMTPLGIISQNLYFAPILGYLDVNYP